MVQKSGDHHLGYINLLNNGINYASTGDRRISEPESTVVTVLSVKIELGIPQTKTWKKPPSSGHWRRGRTQATVVDASEIQLTTTVWMYKKPCK